MREVLSRSFEPTQRLVREVHFQIGSMVVPAGPEPPNEGPAWLPIIFLPPARASEDDVADPPTAAATTVRALALDFGRTPVRPPGAPTRPQPRWT